MCISKWQNILVVNSLIMTCFREPKHSWVVHRHKLVISLRGIKHESDRAIF
jgi:hypothetical protein